MEMCSLCKGEFASGEEYAGHVCPVTGHTPQDPEHQGEAFLLQSKEALKRTGSLSDTQAQEIAEKIEAVKQEDIDHKIMLAKTGQFEA